MINFFVLFYILFYFNMTPGIKLYCEAGLCCLTLKDIFFLCSELVQSSRNA